MKKVLATRNMATKWPEESRGKIREMQRKLISAEKRVLELSIALEDREEEINRLKMALAGKNNVGGGSCA
jgi:hypothetical protein